MYWYIDNKNSARYHRNIEESNYITYILSLIFIWILNDKYNLDYITM